MPEEPSFSVMILSCNTLGEADQKDLKGEKLCVNELNGLSVLTDLNSSSEQRRLRATKYMWFFYAAGQRANGGAW